MKLVWVILLCITLISFIYPGYAVFNGDQRLFLPWVQRALNPALYASDPVASVDHMRFSLFDELAVISVNSLGLNFYLFLFLVAVLTRFIYFYAIYRLSLYFTKSKTFSLLAPLLFMTNLIVFGSAMDTMIYETHHRTVSLALSLLFLAVYLDTKSSWAVVLLIGALVMNPLTVAPFLLFYIVDIFRRRLKPKYV